MLSLPIVVFLTTNIRRKQRGRKEGFSRPGWCQKVNSVGSHVCVLFCPPRSIKVYNWWCGKRSYLHLWFEHFCGVACGSVDSSTRRGPCEYEWCTCRQYWLLRDGFCDKTWRLKANVHLLSYLAGSGTVIESAYLWVGGSDGPAKVMADVYVHTLSVAHIRPATIHPRTVPTTRYIPLRVLCMILG